MSDDYSQDKSTTGVLRVGDSVTGEIETRGDVDWIKVRLQAGMTYRIDLEGAASRAGSLYDPSLQGIYDTRATLLPDTDDDDSGTGFNSRLFLTAGRAGDYYVAVGARGSSTGHLQAAGGGGGGGRCPGRRDRPARHGGAGHRRD